MLESVNKMLQNKQEIFNELNDDLQNYVGSTFEWMYEDVFCSNNRNYLAEQAKEDLEKFKNIPDLDEVETKFIGIKGAQDMIKQYAEWISEDVNTDLNNPSTVANKIDQIRVTNYLQNFLDDNYLDWDDTIDDRAIQMFNESYPEIPVF